MEIYQNEVDVNEEMHLWWTLNVALLKFSNMIGSLHYINVFIITTFSSLSEYFMAFNS